MTIILLNLGDEPPAKPVDDWAAWDLAAGEPVARGNREVITQRWPSLSTQWFHGALYDAMFTDARNTGTSSMLGYGCWDGYLPVGPEGHRGRLPRYNLRRYCELFFKPKTTTEADEQIAKLIHGLVLR